MSFVHRLPVSTAALVVAFALTAFPAAAPAAPLPADTTALLSGQPDLMTLLQTPVGFSEVGSQAVDSNGGLIAFTSSSDGLLTTDDDDVENVYVKDVASGAVTLVSVAADGSPSHADCSEPAISDDGTHVAFACSGSLVPADPGKNEQVYVRDLVHNTTTLVSRASANGAVGDQQSDEPSIDATGAHIAFVSDSTNFGDGSPTSRQFDSVFRRTIGNGDATVLVSRATGAAGAAADEGSNSPSIDNSGDDVAFSTEARLGPADPNTNSHDDIYVRTISASTTTLVSRASGNAAEVANGAIGDHDSFDPAISGNGLFVSFESQSTNLDPAQVANTFDEVFRRSLADNTTRLVSTRVDGTEAHGDSSESEIDDSGNVISFVSDADNLDPAVTTARSQIYVRSLSATTPSLVIASRADGANGAVSQAPFIDSSGSLSGDGTKVAMSVFGLTADTDPSLPPVVVRDLRAATTRTVSRAQGNAPQIDTGGFNDGGSVSADGRYVAFSTSAPGLLGGVPDAIVVRDMVTGALTLVSRQDGPDGAPLPGGAVDEPQISADGHRVAFAWSPDGESGPAQIFVRDIPAGRTFIASRANGVNGATNPNNGTEFHSLQISDDGSRVAWVTDASNQIFSPDDPDGDFDVYVRDVNSGTTFLASRPNGVLTGPGKGNSGVGQDIALSGDGRRVAFSTTSSNLGDGDTNSIEDVHVRTIDTGVTQLVSSTPSGVHGDQASFDPTINRDGSVVGFVSKASTFGPTPSATRLFVRNLAANTLTVAGRADGPTGAVVALPDDSDGQQPLMSADGTTIVFEAGGSTPVAPGDPADGFFRLYARNLVTGTTRLVSRATGADGAPFAGLGRLSVSGVTADGGCVTFSAPATIADSAASTDFPQLYMRVFEPDCGRTVAGGGGSGDGSGGSGGSKPDRTAPKLTSVRLSHTRFRVGRNATTLSLRVSEASKLTITVQRERPGKRGGTKRKPTCHTVAHAPKSHACIALVTDGKITRTLKAGSVKIALDGRVGGHGLAAGAHRLVLVARDAAGNASKPVTVRFTVLKAKAKTKPSVNARR
jgi:hypothetical protein